MERSVSPVSYSRGRRHEEVRDASEIDDDIKELKYERLTVEPPPYCALPALYPVSVSPPLPPSPPPNHTLCTPTPPVEEFMVPIHAPVPKAAYVQPPSSSSSHSLI